MLTVEDIKRLKVLRVKCDNDGMFFTRHFYKRITGRKFIQNWHHHEIFDSFKKIENYEAVFLNINMPPRMSKTEIAVNFIARNLGRNPAGNYLYITSSDDLRNEFSTKVRQIVTDPEFKQLYGVQLRADQNAKNLWRTKQGGGLKTATIHGQITGFGAGQMTDSEDFDSILDYIRDFEGCIILDDIDKISDAVAQSANNTKVGARLFDTVLSRKNSNDTPLINIQQRAGIKDASAVLLDYFNEGYPKDKVINLVLPVVFPDGKLLWEWKVPLAEVERLRNHPKTAHTFSAQYMQDPKPSEGLMFTDRFKTYDELPYENIETSEGLEKKLLGLSLAAIDTADKGTDNFSAPFVQLVGEKVYLKDVIFNTDELIDQEEPATTKIKVNKTKKLIIETNNAGNYFKGRMKKKVRSLTIFGQWNSTNKIGRIRSMAGFISKYLYVPKNPSSEMLAFLEQCYRLEKTSKKEDDAPDSLAILFEHIEKYYKAFE